MSKRHVTDRKNVMNKRTGMDPRTGMDRKNFMYKRTVVDKRNLAFGRTNFILLTISAVVIIIGFLLMSGPGSTVEKFNPDIFGTMRVKVAPVVCFLGFISMIVGVMYRKKDAERNDDDLPEKTTIDPV